MPTSPRKAYLAHVTALQQQVDVLRECGDQQELEEAIADMRRILEELETV